jgi:hypothetical protein
MCLSFDGGGCADGAGGKRPKTIARAGRYKGFAQARTSVARALLGGAGTGAVSGAGAGAGVSCKANAHSQGGSESGSTKHGNKRKRTNAGAEPCEKRSREVTLAGLTIGAGALGHLTVCERWRWLEERCVCVLK